MDSSHQPAEHVDDLSGSDSGKDSLPVCIYFYLNVSLRKNVVDLSDRHLEKEVLLKSQSKFPVLWTC